MVGVRPLRVYGIVPEAWNDYKGNNSFFLSVFGYVFLEHIFILIKFF